MRSRYLVTRPRISDRTRIRHQDQEEGGEGEGERMMPQETSMQGAGMGAGGRLDQVCVVRSSLFLWQQAKCKYLRKTSSQAATLLAHARELLDDQRHQRGLGPGTNGAPGAPKQTMQTEIRWKKISVLMKLPVLQFYEFFHPPSSIIHLKKQNKQKDISRIIPFYLIVHALVVS